MDHTNLIERAKAFVNAVATHAPWAKIEAFYGIGALKPGDQIRARFAQFFEFKDCLIWRQRNYDCFDPW
jgi:hypothetical protein